MSYLLYAPVRRAPNMHRRLLTAALLAFILAGPANAGLIVEVPQTLTATVGGTVGFDVVVQYSGTDSGPIDLAGYTVGISVPTNSGILMTSVDAATSPLSYVFDFPGSGAQGPTPVDPIGTGVSSLVYYDLTDSTSPAPLPARTLNFGDEYALGHITLSITAGVLPGQYGLILEPPPSQGGLTDLNTPQGDSVISDVQSGSIIVSGALSAPEPSTLVLWLPGLAALGGVLLRRRHR